MQNLLFHTYCTSNTDKIKQLTFSLLSLRLLFRLFRAAGGGLGGGPRGSAGGPDLSRCLLKPLLGGRGDRLLGRFLGTENDRDLKYMQSQLKQQSVWWTKNMSIG